MAARRLGIGLKLTGIYLIIAIPLLTAVGLLFALRYDERVEAAIQERRDVAQVTSEGFVAEIDSIALIMRFVMRHALDEQRTPEEIRSELHAAEANFPIQYSAMLDGSGRVVGSTEQSLLGEDLSEEPAVRPLLESNRLVANSNVTTGARGDTGFFVGVALTSRSGEVQAMVVSFIPLRLLQERAPLLLRSGFAHIVDGNGRLVYSSRDPRYVDLTADWGAAPFVRAALRGRSISGEYDHPVTGEPVLVAEQPIPLYGWSAGSAVPVGEVLGAQRRQLLALVAMLVAVQIAVIAVVAYLSRRLVVPLTQLVEDSRAVGEGRFDHEFHASTGDEIEDLAEAMDHTRRRLKRYVEGLSELVDNGRELSATFDPEVLDRIVIEGATDLFGATEVWMLLEAEDGGYAPRLLYGTDLDAAPLGAAKDSPLLAEVIRTGVAHVIPDVADLEPSVWAQRAAARDIHSVALLPLTSREGGYGILGVAAPQVMPWAEEQRERELLELFAGQVSDALENARLFGQVRRLAEDNQRLYDRERDIAVRLQESLLRIPASIPGVRFQHLYRSAIPAMLVGGDFYDLFDLGTQRLAVVVGDVSGKGLEAATMISFVKSSLRAYAYEGKRPAEVLASINDAVRRLSQPNEFVTVFFGVLECTGGGLTYCSAGHPPALVRRQSAEDGAVVEELDVGSPLLGAFDGATFVDGTTTLALGDTLLAYTDGVSEARDGSGELFGSERIAEALRDAPADADVTRFVYERVAAYASGQLSDDIAMLALTPESPFCELPS